MISSLQIKFYFLVYTKQQEKQLREDSQTRDQADEGVKNKLKKQISIPFLNKDTISFNNIPSVLKPRKSCKETQNSNVLKENFQSLDLNHSASLRNAKLVTLPFDKTSRLALESSVLSNCPSLTSNTSNNSSYRTISNSSSTSTDTDSGANQVESFLKSCPDSKNSPHRYQQDMLMTNNQKSLNYKSSSPVINQPQLVSHTMSTSVFMSPNMKTPVHNGVNKTQTLTPKSSAQANSNTENKITSLSYLDESNLQLACVDPNDLTKFTKLQQSIDHNEWLAYNSKFFLSSITIF